MTRILALSSQVAFGHVGLSAALPALTLLGHQVTPLPTVILSNHPGWDHVSGIPVPVDGLRAMVDAFDANGWLARHGAILTGYLPSVPHVELAAQLIDRMRTARPGLRVVVDPVLGDAPKGLYIAEDVAAAIRDRLAPSAGILTPNRFELGWLTESSTDTLDQVRHVAQGLGGRICVTSVGSRNGETGILDVSPDGVRHFPVPFLKGVPHGTGDVFSALVAAGLGTGQALGHLQALIRQSLGAGHLSIVAAAPVWTCAGPVASRSLAGSPPISHQ